MSDSSSRFSHSFLWEWQRSLFQLSGPQLWERCPHSSPSTWTNSALARNYAFVLLGLLKDSKDSPVLAVEVGAGAGKLAFLVLKHLLDIVEKDKMPKNILGKFTYVISDLVEENVLFCKNHASLRHFIDIGILDFAQMDVEFDHDLNLMIAKKSLREICDCKQAAVALIANCVFGNLRQDLFRFVDGEIQEGIAFINSEISLEADPYDPGLIKRAHLSWNWNNLVKEANRINYYSGRFFFLNDIIFQMSMNPELSNSILSVPIGAIRCIETFLRLSRCNLVILCGDHGIISELQMVDCLLPLMETHESFSMPINFLVLEKVLNNYAQICNPIPFMVDVLSSAYLEGFKSFSAFISSKSSTGAEMKYTEAMSNFKNRFIYENFPSHVAEIQHFIFSQNASRPSLRLLLSILRLSNHDSECFFDLSDHFIEKCWVPKDWTSLTLRQDMLFDLESVLNLTYPLNPNRDVAFEIGRIFLRLREFEKAASAFKKSLSHNERNFPAWVNLATALEQANELESAKSAYERALQLQLDSKNAIQGIHRIEKAFLCTTAGTSDWSQGSMSLAAEVAEHDASQPELAPSPSKSDSN